MFGLNDATCELAPSWSPCDTASAAQKLKDRDNGEATTTIDGSNEDNGRRRLRATSRCAMLSFVCHLLLVTPTVVDGFQTTNSQTRNDHINCGSVEANNNVAQHDRHQFSRRYQARQQSQQRQQRWITTTMLRGTFTDDELATDRDSDQHPNKNEASLDVPPISQPPSSSSSMMLTAADSYFFNVSKESSHKSTSARTHQSMHSTSSSTSFSQPTSEPHAQSTTIISGNDFLSFRSKARDNAAIQTDVQTTINGDVGESKDSAKSNASPPADEEMDGISSQGGWRRPFQVLRSSIFHRRKRRRRDSDDETSDNASAATTTTPTAATPTAATPTAATPTAATPTAATHTASESNQQQTAVNENMPTIPGTVDQQIMEMGEGIYSTAQNFTSDVASTITGRLSSMNRSVSLRQLWKRRHARSFEDGIRGQTTDTESRLTSLLTRTKLNETAPTGRRPIERILMGLINAVAVEVEGIDVNLHSVAKTPFWRKEVDSLQIDFNRLGFQPLRMGGIHKNTNASNTQQLLLQQQQQLRQEQQLQEELRQQQQQQISLLDATAVARPDDDLSLVDSADEAFLRIDADNSGTLDTEELATAIAMLSSFRVDKESASKIARELVDIYDLNGDGVVDREEYQQMIEDMANLQHSQTIKKKKEEEKASFGDSVMGMFNGVRKMLNMTNLTTAATTSTATNSEEADGTDELMMMEPDWGSIVLSDMKLDLRRLVFGGIPLIKRIAPGGPLVLEPFTVTVSGSFNSEDVLGSFLLDFGLRSLVARALRVRLRSFRDVIDGALLFGRQWKMASKTAPVVDVLGLESVEFDDRNKMVITGRARIRASPDAPIVTNTFKVRTKIGTGRNGQSIRLVEPELAFVLECPEALEKGLGIVCEKLGMPAPKRPDPIYSFFPIYSPFKVDENAGYDMGNDNCMEEIYIRDGALRFRMRAVLRPGRFLGSHYLAFTVPERTFIITMDRVKEGIKTARKNKKIAALEKKLKADEAAKLQPRNLTKTSRWKSLSPIVSFSSIKSKLQSTGSIRRKVFRWKSRQQPKSFFSRFVEGYTLSEERDEGEELSEAISTFFGRQSGSNFTARSAEV